MTKADFIPAGITPYDNGKIKMGIYYQKPKYVEYDSDMLEIQKSVSYTHLTLPTNREV